MRSLTPLSRELLADQVAGLLRQEIASGRWRDWLPGERSLSRVLGVSRSTLRSALSQLAESRQLKICARQGYRLRDPLGTPTQGTPAVRMVGLICPEQIFSMPAYVIQLVDLLRSACAEAGLHLEIFEGRRFLRNDPGRIMPQLVRSQPMDCWIAIMADRRMQQWFVRNGIPAVIYGNVFPEFALPCAGIDYHACIRHATALLLGKGHRRIAMISHDPRRAGELESLAGFKEAFRAHAGELTEPIVLARPDDDSVALCRQVDRMMNSARPPTAFVVCRTHHYATVATHLTRRGWQIPGQVSLICRGEDTFLHFLRPIPAFYRVNIEGLARALFRQVRQVVAGASRAGERQRLVPEFVPGETVAPCRPF